MERVRIGIGAIVYLTVVLDETVEKIISVANKSTSGDISTESIIEACKNDDSLKHLYYELFI
jgi:hypothetical protein